MRDDEGGAGQSPGKGGAVAVKIADFGSAQGGAGAGAGLGGANCGTPEYQAPELLEPQPPPPAGLGGGGGHGDSSGSAADAWSLGVVLYRCLCGFAPFSESPEHATWHGTAHSLAQQIVQGRLRFPSPHWDGTSAEAKDLVRRLLTVDAAARTTAAGALGHKWLAHHRAGAKRPLLVPGAGDGGGVRNLRQKTDPAV